MSSSENVRSEDSANHSQALSEMARGFIRGKTLCAGVRLGVFDALEEEASVESLATTLKVDASALHRLLRALASIGVLRERDGARYSLSELGQPLRRSATPSVWASMIFWSDLIADSWTYLDECVRVGGMHGVASALERHGNRSRWSLEKNAQEIFHAVFAEPEPTDFTVYAESFDFSSASVVGDLGGGGGGLLSAVLHRWPHLRGVLADRPEAIEGARARFAKEGLEDRVECVGGDLMEGVPKGLDVMMMSRLLHGYEDDQVVKFLGLCRDVMNEAARLLLIETVLPDQVMGADPQAEAQFSSDLNMLVVTGGRERTRDDWAMLLERASLRLDRVISLPGDDFGKIVVASPR